MVAGDKVDRAVGEGLPEEFAVGFAANGRGAFQVGGAVGDALGSKVEVVGAGLDRDRQALCFGCAEQRQSLRGGEMDDVDARAELAAERDEKADGGKFGLLRAA